MVWRAVRKALESRTALVIGVVVSLAVPVATLPHLPRMTFWPIVLGLVPWVVGKYLLCPLRWRALTSAGLSRWWHLRAYAESELLGLFTPGHVGADLWRIHRLTRTGLRRPEALVSVGLDRSVGAVALTLLVGLAGAALPVRMLAVTAGVVAVLVVALLVVRRRHPHLLPRQKWPSPGRFAYGLLLSVGYQLTIAALLVATLAATGHFVAPLALMGVFGVSQAAAVVPGPNGAGAREGALVLGLVALGVPLTAAAAAVTLKAALAWAPALTLGGVSLLVTRMSRRSEPAPAA